jgi:hypothetical protein
MYGIHQPFYICPSTGCFAQSAELGAAPSGSLQGITISTSPQILLEQRTKVTASLRAAGGPVEHVNIAYYDGDPSKGGQLLDVQKITHMDPGASYYHRSFFTPEACGAHTLYASAWVANSPEVQATAATNVTLQPADFVQALTASTNSANITDAALRSALLKQLSAASIGFQNNWNQTAQEALRTFVQQVSAASGSGISAASANRLIGQANIVFGCNPIGFSIAASPASATVVAGKSASYALAITPVGGFVGSIVLNCTGAPQGTNCATSPVLIKLDGTSGSQATLTIATTPRSTAAGMTGPLPGGQDRWKWFMMFLLTMLLNGWLQRERLRHKLLWHAVLGSLLLVLLGGGLSGCGGAGPSTSKPGTPAGTYTVNLTATSGSTVKNTTLTLVVN